MLSKLALIFPFIAGIFALGYLDKNSGILIFVFAALIIIPVIFRKYFYIIMAISFAAGGFLQIHYQAVSSERARAVYEKMPEKLVGVITDEISEYDNSTYFYIKLDNNIKAQIKLKKNSMLYPGYIVEIHDPKISAVNINNKISTNNTKLLGRDTFLSVECEEISVIDFDNWYFLQYGGKILREKSSNLMKKHFYSKEADICAAMFSGESFSMDTDFYDKLISSGTIHIIVVSGSHFAMLYMILFLFLTFFIKNRRLKLYIILPFLIFFVFFTGSTITVIRSFVMSAIVLFADVFYIRRANTRVAVLATAAIFMTLTPTLAYSPSFLLSFGAVLGMCLYQSDIAGKIPEKWGMLRDFISVFLSAQIFTAPIIYYFFARISKVAFLANLLLEPVVALILAMTILFIAAAPFGYHAASLVAWALNWLLKYFIWVVEWTASLDIWGDTGSPYSIATAMFIVSAFTGFFFFINLKDKRIKITALTLSVFMLIYAVSSLFFFKADKYYITFLGSEKTNSAIINLKDNKVLYYGSVSDLYYYKSEITNGTEIPLMIITEISDERMLYDILDIYKVKNIVACEELEPSLHWLKNVTFMTEKNYKTTLSGLNINIISSGKFFKEVIFDYEGSVISFANDPHFLCTPNKTLILNPEIILEKTFDKSIVLLSKKYYNSNGIEKYDNFSIIEFSEEGVIVK